MTEERWEGSGGRKKSFIATKEEGGPKRPEASGTSRAVNSREQRR
jgi:hypothetical protein